MNLDDVEESFDYFSCIVGVRGDSTGLGDFPMELLQTHSGLPVGTDSLVKHTRSRQHFEEQTITLPREYKGDGEYLSVHHPDEPGARDNYLDTTALMVMGVSAERSGKFYLREAND